MTTILKKESCEIIVSAVPCRSTGCPVSRFRVQRSFKLKEQEGRDYAGIKIDKLKKKFPKIFLNKQFIETHVVL